MTDAVAVAATPVSQTEGTPAPKEMSTSAVNAASAASSANQQAAAAGESLGNDGQVPQGPDASQAPPATQEAATLTPAATGLFAPSGDATIDQIGQLLANKQFAGAQDILNEVVSNQELSLQSKAKLVDEMGADVAGLIISTLDKSVADIKAKGAAEGARLKEYAFGKLGGDSADATWSRLQEHAQYDQDMTAQDKQIMNEMLSAGGLKAEMVIDNLINKYTDSSDYRKDPNLMQGDMPTGGGFNMLSRQAYQEQIGPAISQYGENSQEVQALRQRRTISMSRGYN